MKVLIADDCPTTRRVLQRNVTDWGYEAVTVEDGIQAAKVLIHDDAPRLVLLDWMMPGMEGPEVCRLVRAKAEAIYRYIIFLSANPIAEAAVEALQAGADDFLAKPVAREELHQRIRAGERIIRLQDRLLSTQDQLRELARRDPLTRVLNRNALTECLRRALSDSAITNSPVGLLMIDIDHFKSVNDTFGHLAGDQVLCGVTNAIKDAVTGVGEIGRYGGEEFAVVLADHNVTQAAAVAEQIREAVYAHAYDFEDERIRVACSIGVAADYQLSERSIDGLLRAADQALYDAKDSGRDRCCCFAHSMPIARMK